MIQTPVEYGVIAFLQISGGRSREWGEVKRRERSAYSVDLFALSP